MSNKSKRTNSLKSDALTLEDISPGSQILTWRPGENDSVQHLKILGYPYTDAEEDLVVLVCDSRTGGDERVVTTGSIGLTSGRYSEDWYAIAILDDQL